MVVKTGIGLSVNSLQNFLCLSVVCVISQLVVVNVMYVLCGSMRANAQSQRLRSLKPELNENLCVRIEAIEVQPFCSLVAHTKYRYVKMLYAQL